MSVIRKAQGAPAPYASATSRSRTRITSFAPAVAVAVAGLLATSIATVGLLASSPAAAGLLPSSPAAAPLTSYLQLSSEFKPEGKAGFALEERRVRVNGDLTFRADGSRAKATPKIASSFALGVAFRLDTSLRLPDLGLASLSGTRSDTKISVRTLPSFVTQLEARLQHGSGDSKESLKLGFANMLKSTRVPGLGTMDLRAAIAVEGDGVDRVVLPQLDSKLALGRVLNVVTHLCAEESSIGSECKHRLDSRLRVDRLPSFAAIEGRVQRSENGALRQSLSFGFSEKFGEPEAGSSPFSLQGKATYEHTERPGRPDDSRIGFETVLHEFMPSFIPGRDKLTLRVQSRSGMHDDRKTMVTYDHAWAATRYPAEVAFRLELAKADDGQSEPTLDVTWNSRF